MIPDLLCSVSDLLTPYSGGDIKGRFKRRIFRRGLRLTVI